MQIDDSRGTFADLLSNIPQPIVIVAYKLRDIIAEVCPEAYEVPRPAEQHAEYGIGMKSAREIFAYICPMKAYVRLGFYYGNSLPDPARKLVGEGKRRRHVQITSVGEAEQPEIRELIRKALEERKTALGIT